MKLSNNKLFYFTFILLLLAIGVFYFFQKESSADFLNRCDSSVGTYVKEKSFGNFKIKLKYRSPKYMATAQRLKVNNDNDFDYQELVDEYSNSSNYLLQFENMEGGDLLKGIARSVEDYQALVNYFSFDIQKDLYLCLPSDTIPCSFAHFERNFDVAPFTNVEIGFSNVHGLITKNSEWTILYNADRFNIGPLYFRFKENDVRE